MIKGSLMDFLFDRSHPNDSRKSHCQIHSEGKARRPNHERSDSDSRALSLNKQSNKIIKITQFNSSLLIGDDRLMHSGVGHNMQSPQKQFTIKKMAEFKNKVIVNAQKTVELTLKKKDQVQMHQPKPPSTKTNFINKKSTNKMLVATRCNVNSNNDLPSLERLFESTSNNQAEEEEEVFVRKLSTKKLRDLSDVLKMQKIEIKVAKDALAQTYQSLKRNECRQEEKEKARQWAEGSIQMKFESDELSNPPLLRLGSPRKIYSRHILEQKKYQENLEKEKREILELKKELNKNYAKPFNPPQNITAQAYIVFETDIKKVQYNRKVSLKREEPEPGSEPKKMLIHSHKVLASLNPRVAAEVASLTKIMTCLLTLEIGKKFGVQLQEEEVIIGLFQQNIGGTSAHIKKGEIYTVEQLLFGLMLPSGNDASLALAVWGGRKLLEFQSSNRLGSSHQNIRAEITSSASFPKREALSRFISEMNVKANDLNMQKTRYANSHGLANLDNKSCPFDLSILCEYAMNNTVFRSIVSTKVYECEIKIDAEPNQLKGSQSLKHLEKGGLRKKDSLFDPSYGLMEVEEMKDTEEINEEFGEEEDGLEGEGAASDNSKFIRWQNSHLLLQNKSDVYVGIKTGVTTNSGPCLSSCIEHKGRRFIIVVLNCKTMKFRFKDTQNLRKWLFGRQGWKFTEKVLPKEEES